MSDDAAEFDGTWGGLCVECGKQVKPGTGVSETRHKPEECSAQRTTPAPTPLGARRTTSITRIARPW